MSDRAFLLAYPLVQSRIAHSSDAAFRSLSYSDRSDRSAETGMWFDPIMAGVLRSPIHGLLSHNTMLITVFGKKTGRRLTTPVNYFRRGDELLTVSLRSRKWWRNLRGGAQVGLVLAGREREAFASVAESDSEICRGLAEIIASSPSMARPLAIGLDEVGRPRPADLACASERRVIVRARLRSLPS